MRAGVRVTVRVACSKSVSTSAARNISFLSLFMRDDFPAVGPWVRVRVSVRVWARVRVWVRVRARVRVGVRVRVPVGVRVRVRVRVRVGVRGRAESGSSSPVFCSSTAPAAAIWRARSACSPG